MWHYFSYINDNFSSNKGNISDRLLGKEKSLKNINSKCWSRKHRPDDKPVSVRMFDICRVVCPASNRWRASVNRWSGSASNCRAFSRILRLLLMLPNNYTLYNIIKNVIPYPKFNLCYLLKQWYIIYRAHVNKFLQLLELSLGSLFKRHRTVRPDWRRVPRFLMRHSFKMAQNIWCLGFQF